MSTRRIAVLSTLAVLSCWLAVPSFADSQARIVRLSQVDGDVQIDRNTGQGYEKAFINLPITQGTKLRAGQDARAEIEFEDGSTLRITPGYGRGISRAGAARLRRPGLEPGTSGGTAYLNFKGDKQEEFTLAFGQDRLALTKPAHLRIELKDANATVAVFKGDVEVDSASGRVKVEKKHSATFALAGTGPYTLANNLEPDPYDEWDKQQDKYHQQYSVSNSYSPYALRGQRPELLRQLLQHPRLRNDVAALSGRGGLGPLHERRLDVVSREPDMPGSPLTRGAGRLIVMVPGPTSTPMDGSGSREAPGRDGTPSPES